MNAANVFPYCADFLTEKALAALHIKTNSLLHQYNLSFGNNQYMRHCAVVRFLGLSCDISEAGEVMQILCSKLNILAEQDFILATLTPLTIIVFAAASSPEYHDKCAVMSYVALTPKGEEYIKEHMAYLDTPEGAIPKLCSDEIKGKVEDTSTYAVYEE